MTATQTALSLSMNHKTTPRFESKSTHINVQKKVNFAAWWKESEVVSDGWRRYDGLVDVGFDKHLRTNHRQALAQDGVHINGIEFFWSFTKRRLAKFDSIKINFDIHLKESEWHWRKDLDNMMTQIKQMMIYNLIFNIKS